MTIRQHLERRCRLTVTGTVIFLIVIGASFDIVPRMFPLRFVITVLIAAVVIAAFWSQFEIPCPHCRRSLGRLGFLAGNGLSRSAAPRCLHCGTSIDADMSEGAGNAS